jgi:hypothetical protein
MGNDAEFDKEQRELDYEDDRFLSDPNVDNLISVLNDLFNPRYTSDIFKECENISDCINMMSYLIF